MDRKPYQDAPTSNSYDKAYPGHSSKKIPIYNEAAAYERPLLDFVHDSLLEEYRLQAELISVIDNSVRRIIMQPETPEPIKEQSSSTDNFECKIKSVLRMHHENTNMLRSIYDNLSKII